MFAGHYGAAYAVKRWRPEIPIAVLFVAVQLVDVAWGVFVLLGVEKVRIVPGITATNPLDLYYMPFTHGLLSSLAWAVGGGAVYALLRHRGAAARITLAVAAAVFSHWLADFLVHRPDLPLYDNTAKVGLGLWNYPVVAFLTEGGVLLGGLVLYVRGRPASDRLGAIGPWVMCGALLVMQLVTFFGKPPETPTQVAILALVSYIALAAAAAWLDRHRVSDTASTA